MAYPIGVPIVTILGEKTIESFIKLYMTIMREW